MPVLIIIGVILVAWLLTRSSGTAAAAAAPETPVESTVEPPSTAFVNAATNAADQWGRAIDQASSSYGVPAIRILAHIMVESAGNPQALGKAGERGLMQETPGALDDVNANYQLGITFDDLWDPVSNIQVGAAYLALGMKRLGGDLDLSSRAYNIGWKTVQKNPLADQVYLDKILTAEAQLQMAGF